MKKNKVNTDLRAAIVGTILIISILVIAAIGVVLYPNLISRITCS